MRCKMRDLVFKTLTSLESKKQDLCIQETMEKVGVLANTERRCRYFIMGKAHIDDINGIEKLAQVKFANVPYRKRHYHVLKTHDERLGEDRLLCKTAGMFYAVHGADVYCIAYIHSFRITFTLVAR